MANWVLAPQSIKAIRFKWGQVLLGQCLTELQQYEVMVHCGLGDKMPMAKWAMEPLYKNFLLYKLVLFLGLLLPLVRLTVLLFVPTVHYGDGDLTVVDNWAMAPR